jgi:flagellar basal-body rod modification protein FlgD
MSIASVAAQQNSATAAANAANAAAGGSGKTAAASTGATALTSLSGNFTDFLKMLMTQLQNQDPTSPMDTNAFTTELVQFSSVEQQINTNTSLTSLIQLTQAGEVMQGSNMTGKQVTVTSDHLALQNGKGTIQFTTASAEPVAIAIYSDSGTKLQDATLTSVKGSNTWTWNGSNASGQDASRRRLQGRGSGRGLQRHRLGRAVQRGRHRNRRAEPVERHTAANRRAVG